MKEGNKMSKNLKNNHFSDVVFGRKSIRAYDETCKISQEEMDYLLTVSNAHFKTQIAQCDVISTFAGVRPLCDDESDNPAAVTRDYTLALSQQDASQAPLLSVFGGKLTTYRKLAEAAMKQLQPFFSNLSPSWTAKEVLPGAENLTTVAALVAEIQDKILDVPVSLAQRWAHAYGTRVWEMLGEATMLQQLGQDFGCGLYAREVDYLFDHEWAQYAEDILWRRSKLALEFNSQKSEHLEAYLALRREMKEAA